MDIVLGRKYLKRLRFLAVFVKLNTRVKGGFVTFLLCLGIGINANEIHSKEVLSIDTISAYACYDSILQHSDLEQRLYYANQFFAHCKSDSSMTSAFSDLDVLVHLSCGAAHFKRGNITETWGHWDYCLGYLAQAPQSALTAEVYFNIGQTLGEVDAPTSILLFRKAMMIFAQSNSSDEALEYRCLKEIINLYVNIAIDAKTLQDVDLAAKHYSSIANNILEDTTINVVESDAATSIYRISAESLIWLGEDSLAADYVTKLQNNNATYSDKALTIAYADMLYGVNAYVNGNNAESINYFTLAIREIGESDSYLNFQLEMPYAYLGAIYYEQNQYDIAIAYMEKSIKCLTSANYETVEDAFQHLPYETLYDANHAFNIILCLERMQDFYQASLASNFSEERLHDFYALSNYTRHFIKSWFLNAASEEMLVQTSRLLKECNETIIEVMQAHTFYDEVDEVFKLASEPGAFYLRYLIQLKDKGVSDKADEARLLKEINALTMALVRFPKDEFSTAYVDKRIALIRAKTLLSSYQKSHIRLLDREKGLDEIRQSLDENTVLVKYLVSDENVYLIACTHDEKKVLKVPFLGYRKQLRQLRRAVKTGAENSEAQRYFYDKLIAPMASMATKKSNLYILNDESLVDLPFEVLQDKRDHFLVDKFNVTYYYSVQGIGDTRTDINNVLAFAPVTFGKNERCVDDRSRSRFGLLKSLEHSKGEVDAIGRLCDENGFNSRVFVGDLATKDHFKTSASEADILHIATHGIGIGQYDKGLVFAGDSYEEQVLLASELYEMDLSCGLVVLSACKTAVGEVAQGEGVMALPRSFIYAGAPNVLAALWNIDDEKTTAFITAFYDNLLRKRYSYARALRKTKLDCIRKGWLPMDWAAFVLISR